MEAMARDLWTDERLDELNVRVERGFETVRQEFVAVRTEMRTEFAAVRGEMAQMRESIDGMQRMMLQLFVPLTVTLVFGFAGMIVALLAQP